MDCRRRGSLTTISIHVPREGHDPCSTIVCLRMFGFQSTCPARGTTHLKTNLKGNLEISIHVPREGHDVDTAKRRVELVAISIHVPREGHDRKIICDVRQRYRFQSTCPARGTTLSFAPGLSFSADFNPRAPRGARLLARSYDVTFLNFNPRAPRGARLFYFILSYNKFNISIHVPREGHDISDAGIFSQSTISIHVPREGHD